MLQRKDADRINPEEPYIDRYKNITIRDVEETASTSQLSLVI